MSRPAAARLNAAGKSILRLMHLINFALHFLGYPGLRWNRRRKIFTTISRGVSLHFLMMIGHSFAYLYMGMMGDFMLIAVMLTLCFLLLRLWFDPTSLCGIANEFVVVTKFVRKILRPNQLFHWHHFLRLLVDIVPTYGCIGYAFFITRHDWLLLIMLLNVEILPVVLGSTTFVGLIIAQALFEQTSAELDNVWLRYELLRYLPTQAKIALLKKISKRIDRMTRSNLRIQQLTESLQVFSETILMWNFILYVMMIVHALRNSEDLLRYTERIFPFFRLLHFAVMAENLETEAKRPLEGIHMGMMNICTAYDKSVEMMVLCGLQTNLQIKILGMFVLRKSLIMKAILLFPFYYLVMNLNCVRSGK